MHNIDIAQQLREALKLSGCSDQQIGEFDSYSTIELEFTDLPSLNMAVTDDDLWFWSSVGELSPSAYSYCAERLLSFLLEGFSFARTGQLQLLMTGEVLEVRVMLRPDVIASPQEMADAIDGYVERLIALREVLR